MDAMKNARMISSFTFIPLVLVVNLMDVGVPATGNQMPMVDVKRNQWHTLTSTELKQKVRYIGNHSEFVDSDSSTTQQLQ